MQEKIETSFVIKEWLVIFPSVLPGIAIDLE